MKRFFLAFAAMLMAFSVSAAEPNIYASGLKAGEVVDNKVEISYVLNAEATDFLTVNFYNGTERVYTLPIEDAALKTKGAHTATIDLSVVPAGTYTWAIEAGAAQRLAMSADLVADSTTLGFYQPRDLEVDVTPESPYFGQIYMTNAREGETAGVYTYSGIHIVDALLNYKGGYGGGVSWAGANADASTTNKQKGAFRVQVADNGLVFVNDAWTTTTGIWVMDPANPSANFTPVLSGNYTTINSFEIVGEGEDRKLITLDGLAYYEGNLQSYAIGNSTNYTEAATVLATAADMKLGNAYTSLESDGRGGFWIIQNRGTEDAGLACLTHISAEGKRDYNSFDNALGINKTTYATLNLNKDKTLLALVSQETEGIVYDVTWNADGKPVLTEKYTFHALNASNVQKNITAVAFDYANNLYVASASVERLFVYATPSDNFCETPAPKASTITVAEAEPITLYFQPNIWDVDGEDEQFGVYYWADGSEGVFAADFLTNVVEGTGADAIYEASVPASADNVIFVRFNASATTPAWDSNVLKQTIDLTIPADKNLFKVTAWDESDANKKSIGEWSVYTPATEPEPAKYVKVTEAPADWTGTYVVVYEASETEAKVFNGLDAINGFTAATIADGAIEAEGLVEVEIAAMEGGYSIQVLGGDNANKFISGTSGSNKLNFDDAAKLNTLALDENGVLITSNTSVLRYNNASNQERFRYYKASSYSGQKAIQLYKKVVPTPAPTSIALNTTYAEVLAFGTLQLEATVEPAGDHVITWTSSDDALATVDANGLVTSKTGEGGFVSITATVGELTSDPCWITLNAAPTELIVSPNHGELTAGETLQLKALGDDENEYNYIATWASSREDVTVSETGLVTVAADAAAGTATITATAAFGTDTLSNQAWLTIVPEGPKSVSITAPESTTLGLGETLQLEATTDVAGEFYFNWETSDDQLATVTTDGLVKVVSAAGGNVWVYVTVDGYEGLKDSIELTLAAGYPNISAEPTSDNIQYGMGSAKIGEEAVFTFLLKGENLAKDVVLTYYPTMATFQDNVLITPDTLSAAALQGDGVALTITVTPGGFAGNRTYPFVYTYVNEDAELEFEFASFTVQVAAVPYENLAAIIADLNAGELYEWDLASVASDLVVTHVSEAGIIELGGASVKQAYIQDATAGVVLTQYGGVDVVRGEHYATLEDCYFSIQEMDYLAEIAEVPLGSPTKTEEAVADVITLADIANHQGRLVRLNGVTFAASEAPFAADGKYAITIGEDAAKVVLFAGSELIGEAVPATTVDLVGIVRSTVEGNIVISPRDKADIIATTPSALDNVTINGEVTKVLRNGQVIIIRDNTEYNVLGTKLQ